MTQMARYDVNDPQNTNDTWVETKWRVSSTGAVLMIRDHLWRSVYISYNDAFSAGGDRSTFAYPTTVTDADGFQSSTKYSFDYGAVTWRQTPSPNSGQTAPTQTFTYDSIGRAQQVTNGVNGAYTRWVYPASHTEVQTFTTIVSGAGEAYAVQVLDGAGRVRATAADHPDSTGLYSGQYLIYDNMGRVAQQSNPTEMNWGWGPTGDDSLWRVTLQAYDWKGRPTQTTNTDGTTKVVSYGGCGCAGGEVTTAQDEHGRQRRTTKDTLGRLAKVEELNWGGSVYATTDYSYNARDQITQSSQAGQLRSFGYDGHGRLQTRTTPEQGTMNYSYNRDDTVNVVTDARGATTNFSYNARHLVTGITYGVPAGVAATNQVGFSYDAAGNRTNMTTWYVGTVNYQYDQLSRMTSETRMFDYVGSFTLNYQYNLAGELTSVTNPWSAQVGYSYDKVGRPTGVTGSGYAGVYSYASALTYRAFGALKGMNYANGRSLTTAYDNRLRPTTWNVAGVLGYNYNYDYFNERSGRVSYAQNIQDATLDRSYEYDHLGRLAISHSGAEARAHAYSGQWGTADGPFSQGYEYDAWGNVTHKYGWGGEVQGGSPSASTDFTYSYTNNRRNGFSYDAAGNLTNDIGQTFTYDATGQQATAAYSGYSMQQVYDGDGLRLKKVENGTTTLYLRSSVLGGQVVAEMNGSGGWTRGFVYLGSQLLAVQQAGVSWMHEDPITKSKRVTNSAGTVVSAIETDPWGADTNRSSNVAFQPRKFTSYDRDQNGTDEAMFRRYNRWQSRFDQPDPYDGSYSLTDPQSFNRYAYVQNDPVNFVDPTGLMFAICHWEISSELGLVGWDCFGGDRWSGFDPKEDPIPEPKEPAQQQRAPCDAQLSGDADADADFAARYIFAESSNDFAEMVAIGQVGANRYTANEARFGGQDWGAVWARLSIADDRGGSNMYNRASPDNLRSLSPQECQKYKDATRAAQRAVRNIRENPDAMALLFSGINWFLGAGAQTPGLRIGATTFYNNDPNPANRPRRRR
jgi:RHS repeat-associated protein